MTKNSMGVSGAMTPSFFVEIFQVVIAALLRSGRAFRFSLLYLD